MKQEQKILKREASNELKEITRKQSNLNQKLKNNPTEEEKKEILETKELYDSKHTAYCKRETENQMMFRHLNLEKPMKWFLNLASDQKDAESPTNKLKKYCDKYKNTPEWGRK